MEDKRYLIPAVDIYETDEEYILSLDMPGALKDTITVTADDAILTITAGVAPREEAWKPLKTEFDLSDYRREIHIGNQVDRDRIEAHYENGILTVRLAKSEAAKPRKIDVKVA